MPRSPLAHSLAHSRHPKGEPFLPANAALRLGKQRAGLTGQERKSAPNAAWRNQDAAAEMLGSVSAQ